MSPERFEVELAQLGLKINEQQLAQFEQYYQLLVEWNQKMNLTAITDKEEVYLKHFFDSLLLAKMPRFTGQESLCDVGSGAGFPSMPLKILYPDLQITIVDSLQKRLTFLETVVAQLDLKNVHLWHGRAEDFGQDKDYRASFDCVTARAVARLNEIGRASCREGVERGGRGRGVE